MTTKTRIQLVNRVAGKLMIKSAGQSLASEDYNVIDDAVDPAIADLNGRDVIYIADDDAVDLDVFEWLADYIADLVAPDFGLPRDANRKATAEQMMHEVAMTRPTYEAQTAEYF